MIQFRVKLILSVLLLAVLLLPALGACGLTGSPTPAKPRLVATALPRAEATATPETTAEPRADDCLPLSDPGRRDTAIDPLDPEPCAEPSPEPTLEPTPEPSPAPLLEPPPQASLPMQGPAPEPPPGGWDARAIYDRAFGLMAEVNSFRYAMSITVQGAEDSSDFVQDFRLVLDGEYLAPDRQRADVNIGLFGITVLMEMVIIGNDMYVQDPIDGEWTRETIPGDSRLGDRALSFDFLLDERLGAQVRHAGLVPTHRGWVHRLEAVPDRPLGSELGDEILEKAVIEEVVYLVGADDSLFHRVAVVASESGPGETAVPDPGVDPGIDPGMGDDGLTGELDPDLFDPDLFDPDLFDPSLFDPDLEDPPDSSDAGSDLMPGQPAPAPSWDVPSAIIAIQVDFSDYNAPVVIEAPLTGRR